ncbi:MAG: Spy/CpxP family protein refolding chaperone [Gemmatimonadaceae bacterium]|nr:Spy/CpxP family protein refolding chaperone [Gemmatimonadaceae bacterium]
MRKLVAVLVLCVAAAGCGDGASPVEPAPDQSVDQILAASGPAATEVAASIGPTIRGLGRLPQHLRLTIAQQEALRALFTAHASAMQADRAALMALVEQLAATNGGTRPAPEQVRQLQQQAAAIVARIAAAGAALETEILALLTPAQRAWIEANTARRCDLRSLTPEQHARVKALRQAFEQSNAADIAHMARVMGEARAAHASGRPRAEIQAILARGAEAMRRLAAAQAELHVAIMAIAGCPAGPPSP